MNKTSISQYIHTHARPVDIALFKFFFSSGPSADVISALEPFQNDDGGFGRALEPDFRLPASSAIATTVALHYLTQINASSDSDMVGKVVNYLLNSYIPDFNGWYRTPAEVNDFPHAPWWDYSPERIKEGWGNPSAEIIGYLNKYSALITNQELLKKLNQQVIFNLLHAEEKMEFHELLSYQRYYENSDQQIKRLIKEKMEQLIKNTATTNPHAWSEYGATPLTFVDSPNSEFIKLFTNQQIQANLNFLQDTVIDDNHWEPKWSWGRDEATWEKAKEEWCGHITVQNAKILANFNRLPAK